MATGFSLGGTPAAGGFSLTGTAPAPSANPFGSVGGGSLFGATPAPAPAGSLFGATPAPAPAAGGLFGATPAPGTAAAPATGGLFGASTGSSFAIGGVGASTTGAATAVASDITYDTPFDRLPPVMQAELKAINDLVHETDLHAQGIAQHSEAPLLELKDSLKTVKQTVLELRNTQQTESNNIQHIKRGIDRDQQHADLAQHTIRHFSTGFARSIQLPSPYFWELLARFDERMDTYAEQIRLLEQILRPPRAPLATGVGGGAGATATMSDLLADGRRLTPELLKRLLVAQNQAFTALAGGQVAEVHNTVEKLRRMYLRLINDYASAVAATGDENAARAAGIEARDVNGVIDPFAREDRSETAARKREAASRKIVVRDQTAPATNTAATATTNLFASTPATTGTNLFGATAAAPTVGFAISAGTPAAASGGFAIGTPAPASGGFAINVNTTATTSANPFASSAASTATPRARRSRRNRRRH